MRTSYAIIALALFAGCHYNPYAHQFTTAPPKHDDVAGSYRLTQQTITQEGLAVLQGPPYGLIMTYGDPDSGTVLIFERTGMDE